MEKFVFRLVFFIFRPPICSASSTVSVPCADYSSLSLYLVVYFFQSFLSIVHAWRYGMLV